MIADFTLLIYIKFKTTYLSRETLAGLLPPCAVFDVFVTAVAGLCDMRYGPAVDEQNVATNLHGVARNSDDALDVILIADAGLNEHADFASMWAPRRK